MDQEALRQNLQAVRRGDRQAFEELYDQLRTPVFTIALRIIGDRHTAEDILQDVFLKLYRSPLPETIANPRAYIFQMARHLAIDSLRKRTSEVDLDQVEFQVADCQEWPDARLDFHRAIQELPLAERQIITLRINGELKFREIAQLLEMPLGTVLWRYRKAIQELRTKL